MSVFTVALIKGAVEGDPYKHFAALGGINHHATPATKAGLLTSDGVTIEATDAGRLFYQIAELSVLPEGRATNWGAVADKALALLATIADCGDAALNPPSRQAGSTT